MMLPRCRRGGGALDEHFAHRGYLPHNRHCRSLGHLGPRSKHQSIATNLGQQHHRCGWCKA